MKIELVSFYYSGSSKKRINWFLDIANNSQSDLLIFPGWTFRNVRDKKQIDFICSQILNNKAHVIFEFNPKQESSEENHICIYSQRDNVKIIGKQSFAFSNQLNKNKVTNFIKELTNDRIYEFKGKKILSLQCGEINILKKDRRGASFRGGDDQEVELYKKLFDSVDIIVNPTHTQMSNQGNLRAKRILCSVKGKIYCSTSNLKPRKKKQNIEIQSYFATYKSIQSCFYDSEEIIGETIKLNNNYLVKRYNINQ